MCPAASLLSEGLQFDNHLEGPGTRCGFLAPSAVPDRPRGQIMLSMGTETVKSKGQGPRLAVDPDAGLTAQPPTASLQVQIAAQQRRAVQS